MVAALAAIRLALALGLLKKKSSTCIKGKIMELVDFCEVKVHSVFGVCSDFIIWLILDKKKYYIRKCDQKCLFKTFFKNF